MGKVRLALTPWLNHSWQVPLYVTARGLSTSPIPAGGEIFEIDFDFIAHRLVVRLSSGTERALALEPKSVADFYREVMDLLQGDLESLQQHAQTTAAIVAALTSGTVWADDAVLAALLHDIGYWVLSQECPGDLARALDLAVAAGIPLHRAETRIITSQIECAPGASRCSRRSPWRWRFPVRTTATLSASHPRGPRRWDRPTCRALAHPSAGMRPRRGRSPAWRRRMRRWADV